MRPVAKRVVANSLLAAAFLGLIGYGMGELAATFLLTQAPDRAVPVEVLSAAEFEAEPDPVGDALRTRVPVMMALWGFVLVAAGELILARRRRLAAPPPAPADPKPDSAERLLEQLLREAEAKSRAAADNTPTKGDVAHVHPG